MSIEALKEQARRHEQKEEWQKALDFYLKAIARLEEKEQPDISLHNRVGDLYTRIGKSGEAVSHYEAAVDLYMESELPNNAIAVCKKVIRNLPNRHEIHLKMGEIRAHQGFLTDARQSFLTYAELMQAQGDIDDALDALIRFMDLAPEDIEMRTALAAQLEQHGRTEEAVQQLIATHQRMVLAGRDDEAGGIEAKIQELAPGTDIPPPPEGGFATPEEGEEFDFASSFSTFGDDDAETTAAAPAAAGGGEMEGDFGEIALSDEDDEEEAAAPAAAATEDVEGDFGEIAIGFDEEEEAGVGAADEEEEAEELPLMEFGEEEEEGEEAEELPLMEFGDEEDEEEAEEAEEVAVGADFGVPDRGDRESSEYVEGAEDLPDLEVGELEEIALGDEEEEAEAAAEGPSEAVEEAMEEAALEEEAEEELPDELPDEMEVVAEPEAEAEPTAELAPPAEPAAAAEAPAEAPAGEATPAASGVSGGPSALQSLGKDMLGQDKAEGTKLLRQALEGYAAADDVQGAYETLQALTGAHPDEVEYHQRLVEYAFRTNDDTKLTPAYLNLAACLERNGQEEKAQAVYQQVLVSDPDNEVAKAALGQTAEPPAEAASERAQVASSEDYVDLGSMILDEEEEEKTTRWKVAYEEPSGDEAADFAKMLSQFKEKVSENVAADDIKAHYDLGTAYKEMGLIDEAIGEFQAALRASAAHLPTYEMLGQCFMEQGQHEAAVRTLSKGLDQPFEVEDELIGIYYYLGRAHEELGNTDSAREFYDKIFTLDINFQDVTERLRSLREA